MNSQNATTVPPPDAMTTRRIMSKALPTIAKELDHLRDLAANGHRTVIEKLGHLEAAVKRLEDQQAATCEVVHEVQAETRRETREALGKIMQTLEGWRADDQQWRKAQEERIARIAREAGLNGSNGNGNGHASA